MSRLTPHHDVIPPKIEIKKPAYGRGNQLMLLADGTVIKMQENLIIPRNIGIGKSYVAAAPGHHTCSIGYKIGCQKSAKLFSGLTLAKANDSYLTELAHMERMSLLIIDDFGIHPLTLLPEQP